MVLMKKFKFLLVAAFLMLGLSANAQFYSVKTNVLGLATGNLNLELSATASRKVSIHLPVNYNPFTYNFIADNCKMKNLTVQPGVRYWFTESYMRWFMGFHAIYSRYHVGWKELSDYRYDGWGVGGGYSVGYSKMLSKRWNFEAELGGSLMWHDFDKYLCKECGSLPDPGHKINFVPTKLSLAFVYLF